MFRGRGYHNQNSQRFSRKDQFQLNCGNTQNHNFVRSRSRSASRFTQNSQGQNANFVRNNRSQSLPRYSHQHQRQQWTNGRGNFNQMKRHNGGAGYGRTKKFYNEGQGTSQSFYDFQGDTQEFHHNRNSQPAFHNNCSSQKYYRNQGYLKKFNQNSKNFRHQQQNFRDNRADSQMDLSEEYFRPSNNCQDIPQYSPQMDHSPPQMLRMDPSGEYFGPSGHHNIRYQTSDPHYPRDMLQCSSSSSFVPEHQKEGGSGANVTQKEEPKKLWVIDETVLAYIRENYPPHRHEQVRKAFEQINNMAIKTLTIYQCYYCSIRFRTEQDLINHKKTQDHIQKRDSFLKNWVETIDIGQ
uniref:C2H2-type domain-containing protein n=2 Tax=Lygus hesperus TaxID=30085 RepID=A0A146LVU2_LYGHE